MDKVLTLCYKHFFETEKELDALASASSGSGDYTPEQKINRYHLINLYQLLESIIKARVEDIKEGN